MSTKTPKKTTKPAPKTSPATSRAPAAPQAKAPSTPTPARAASAPTTPQPPVPPKTTFTLVRSGARAVFLAGSFNGWQPDRTALTPNPQGCWTVELELAPGRYEYRFVADGEWIPDPAARLSAPNPFGGINSVIEISAPPVTGTSKPRGG